MGKRGRRRKKTEYISSRPVKVSCHYRHSYLPEKKTSRSTEWNGEKERERKKERTKKAKLNAVEQTSLYENVACKYIEKDEDCLLHREVEVMRPWR